MKSTQISNTSILGLRITTSGIFLAAGINHLQQPVSIAKRILDAPLGQWLNDIVDVQTLAFSIGILLMTFGVTFLFGIYTRWSALALFLLLIPITITIQVNNGLLHGPLWKNIVIFGSLSFFILNRNLPYSSFSKHLS